MRVLYRLLVALLFLVKLSNIICYKINLDFFVDDRLNALYKNDQLLDNKSGIDVKGERFLATIEGNYGDTITLEIQNLSGPMGISGLLILNENAWTTTEHGALFISSYNQPYDENIKKLRVNYTPKQYYLGWYYNGTVNFTITIPLFFNVIGDQQKIKASDVYVLDLINHFTTQGNQQDIAFEIYKFPDYGTLHLSQDNSTLNPGQKYLPQDFKYYPHIGGRRDIFEFVMGNSTRILSDIGRVTLYICWEGCEDCDENNICIDSDCTIFGEINCLSCENGYGEYTTADSRKECWDSSKDYDYYYLDKNNQYKSCYSSCLRCFDKGDVTTHSCNVCKEGLYFVDQTTNCEGISYKDNGYYLDEDKKFHQCSNNCTLCSGPSKGKVNYCTGCATGYTALYGNCYKRVPPKDKDDPIIDNVDLSAGEILSQNVTKFADPDVIIKGENYSMQIFHTTEDDDKAKGHAKNNKLATVDMDECIKILRVKLNLKADEKITIVKIDKNITNSTVNQVDFLLYDQNGMPIDYSICNDTDITVNKPLLHPELINMEEVKNLHNQGIDAFDSNDNFFNDICYPYNSDNDTDVVLNDRRKDYYQNVSFCENNCRYSEFQIENEIVKCKCKPTSPQEKIDEVNKEKINLSTLQNIFINSIFSSNFIVVKCYKTAFRKSILFNLGFWVGGFFVLCQTILFFSFLYYKLDKLRDYLYVFLENPPKRDELESQWDFFETDQNRVISNPSLKNLIIVYPKADESLPNTKEQIQLTHANSIKLKPRFSKIKRGSNASSFKRKATQNSYLSAEKEKISTKQDISFIKCPLYINSSYKGTSHFHPSSKTKVIQITNIAEEGKELYDPDKHKNLIPIDYEEMTFEEAIEKDPRTFWQMYWSLLQEKQIVISAFCSECFMDLRIIKIYILCFSTSLDFTLNAFFYTDSEISDLYHNDGILDMISSLPQSFYSCAIGFVIGFVISHLSDSKKNLEKILITPEIRTKNEVKKSGLKEIKCLRIKLIFFFLLSFILSGFFWYYVICFCSVYHNTQMAWMKSSLTSMGISQMLPFVISIFLALFRYISLSKYNRCLYKFYKFINLIF